MENSYDIFLESKRIGTMQVEKCGLYYRFSCVCRISDPDVYTVVVRCGEKEVGLGVLVPYGDLFGLRTQLPSKKFGEGEWLFYVQPKCQQPETHIYPVFENKPFTHIDQLSGACFTYKNGQPCIWIKN